MSTRNRRPAPEHPVGVRLAGLVLGLLVLLSPSPADAWHTLTRPQDATAPAELLVAVAAVVAQALAAWLLLVALLTLSARTAGPFGRACGALLRRAAPAAVRQAVAVALGVGVLLSTAGAASAAPAGPAVSAPATAALPPGSLDWPLGAVPAPAPAPPPAAAREVVVRPGDTLWSLAAQALPPDASPARIAASWPSWWSANRDAIGDDPDLLRPGQHLHVPQA